MSSKPAKSTVTKVFRAGEILFEEGDPGGELWIVNRGEVEVFRDIDGTHYHLARLGPKEMLGTMTATTGSERSASVRASSEVEVSIVSREQVKALVDNLPNWTKVFIGDLVSRVQYASELYIDSERRPVHERSDIVVFTLEVARYFDALHESFVQGSGDSRVVDVKGLVSKVAKLLGGDHDIQLITEQLMQSGILHSADRKFATYESFARLSQFVNHVQTLIENTPADARVEPPLASGERKMMREMMSYREERTQPGPIPFNELEDELRRRGHRFDVYPIRRLADLGHLTIDRSTNVHSVTFRTQELELVLATFDVLRSILAESNKSSKRQRGTLMY